MTEQELDLYVGKFVKVVDFRSSTHFGNLYKIINGITKINGNGHICLINRGYCLDSGEGFISYRRSHIKEIEIGG